METGRTEANNWLLKHFRTGKETQKFFKGFPRTFEFRILCLAGLLFVLSLFWIPLILPSAVLLLWLLYASTGKTHTCERKREGKIIAVARIKVRTLFHRRRVSIMGIYVLPEYRSQGLAEDLLVEIFDWTKDKSGVLIAYAPTSSASRRLIQKYFGARKLRISSPEYIAAHIKLQANLFKSCL